MVWPISSTLSARGIDTSTKPSALKVLLAARIADGATGAWPSGSRLVCEMRPTCHNRSEEHTSELQSLMRISYAVFCLKKKTLLHTHTQSNIYNHKDNSN